MVGSLFMLIAIIYLGIYAGGDLLNLPSGFTTNYLAIQEISNQIGLGVQQ
jgi:hypothetical protein